MLLLNFCIFAIRDAFILKGKKAFTPSTAYLLEPDSQSPRWRNLQPVEIEIFPNIFSLVPRVGRENPGNEFELTSTPWLHVITKLHEVRIQFKTSYRIVHKSIWLVVNKNSVSPTDVRKNLLDTCEQMLRKQKKWGKEYFATKPLP